MLRIFYRYARSSIFSITVFVCMGMLSACISDPQTPASISTPILQHSDVTPLSASDSNSADLTFVSFDGRPLPVSVWSAAATRAANDTNPDVKAILIALHGMNDYAFAFDGAARYWAEQNITVYAYDQRTFGRGRLPDDQWPGTQTLVKDLATLEKTVRARHPGIPLFILGHSMGGAVVMAANGQGALGADGIILAAPAIWGGARMPLAYRVSLSVAASLTPGKTLTGARAKRQATDNIPILRVMQRDPNVIKQTTLRAVAGLVRLMGAANKSVDQQSGALLMLVGCRDQMVPVEDLLDVAQSLVQSNQTQTQLLTYPQGWHLLFRDLQARAVWRDVGNWIKHQSMIIGTNAQNADDQNNSAAPPTLTDSGAAPLCSDK